MNEKRVLIIINPCAGTRQANKYLTDIVRLFTDAGYRICVATTKQSGDGAKLIRSHGEEIDLVVCIGGDGTFSEAVEGLSDLDKDIPVGYIPAGSTNDFACSLGLSKNIIEATESIIDGVPKQFDVGNFNGRFFSYVASFGAFTRASYEAPQNLKNILGHMAYILQGIKELPSIKSEEIHMIADNIDIKGKYLFGAISNSTSMGGILTLDSDAVDMCDGLFEVLLIKSPNNLIELNQIIFALTTMNYNSPMINFFSAKEITIEASADMPWTLDGEFQEGSEKILIKNVHPGVTLITPKEV